ncbi:MAG: YbhB/YbcL family Raf kinase inhibitor-like protein [Propionibacteriaceae bacterium]|nr:YbhB/YbcL family Raf kinase inhibitor-like protein [Propionibacteriaceae bacterium]
MKIDPSRPYPPAPYSEQPSVPSFTLVSADFEDGQPLPVRQTGTGGNISPRLTWSGFPEATKSFLVTATDPDARRGTSWHWVVSDIPATITSLPAGRRRGVPQILATIVFYRRQAMAGVPGSLERCNSMAATGFLGALPPKGDHPHRYVFAVHALDVEHLDVDSKAKPQRVLDAAAPHTLARALITGTYQR